MECNKYSGEIQKTQGQEYLDNLLERVLASKQLGEQALRPTIEQAQEEQTLLTDTPQELTEQEKKPRAEQLLDTLEAIRQNEENLSHINERSPKEDYKFDPNQHMRAFLKETEAIAVSEDLYTLWVYTYVRQDQALNMKARGHDPTEIYDRLYTSPKPKPFNEYTGLDSNSDRGLFWYFYRQPLVNETNDFKTWHGTDYSEAPVRVAHHSNSKRLSRDGKTHIFWQPTATDIDNAQPRLVKARNIALNIFHLPDVAPIDPATQAGTSHVYTLRLNPDRQEGEWPFLAEFNDLGVPEIYRPLLHNSILERYKRDADPEQSPDELNTMVRNLVAALERGEKGPFDLRA